MAVCAVISFRLGLSDGVSIVATAWQRALASFGWQTYTVAGEGPVDRTVPGLAIGADNPPDRDELEAALDGADVVLVENALSIPMNLAASRLLATVLAGRPAVLHHHDPPWQRERFAHITELPPTDPEWRHVTINRMTEREFAERGIEATTIYNGFDTNPPPGNRTETRDWLGLDDNTMLVAHPVRAIARKNIPTALTMVEKLGGVYWLPNPAEEDYDRELEVILAEAGCPVLRTPIRGSRFEIEDLYAAADLIAFPSTWEGFGNPPIEAALHRRPVAVGRYPVAEELRDLGFLWLDPDDADTIATALRNGLTEMLDRNQQLAREHLSVEKMSAEVEDLFDKAGWRP